MDPGRPRTHKEWWRGVARVAGNEMVFLLLYMKVLCDINHKIRYKIKTRWLRLGKTKKFMPCFN